jgi:2-phosphosulfolactate phosphatase
MGKIHVLLRKEDLDHTRIQDSIVVIIDVLLATSTIATALYHGAKEVIPVFDEKEALAAAKGLEDGSYVLVGEKDGYTISGFSGPSPNQLIKSNVKGKTVILSTTNGTVAVRKSMDAKKIYTSSLLNGKSLAERIRSDYEDETIIIVCSGSGGEFSLEDFYGAGYLIAQLIEGNLSEWHLTDASLAALGFYQHCPQTSEKCLIDSRIGQFIVRLGYEEDIYYVAKQGILPVAPQLVNGRLVICI